MNKDEEFERHRGLVFSIAYNILGSVSDAEDTTHNTYLRWREANAEIGNPRAYLARIAANQALSLVRTLRTRRVEYVGPWLPEPLMTHSTRAEATASNSTVIPQPEESALSSEAVSTALLVLLQTLGDDERTVFILREVFDFPYREIAVAISKSDAAVRQIAHRAREQVRSRGRDRPVDAQHHANVVSSFVHAVNTGDLHTLLTLIDPDVVLTSDGGGKVNAARKPIAGVDKVIRFLSGIVQRDGAGTSVSLVELNGLTGVVVRNATGVIGAIQLDVDDDRIRSVFITVNPDKLMHL